MESDVVGQTLRQAREAWLAVEPVVSKGALCLREGRGTAQQRLHREVLQAIKESVRKEPCIFLELFCGEGGLSKEIKKLGCATLALDIRRGAHHDLRDPLVFSFLKRLIEEGRVWGAWSGTPCNTFSRARRAQLDSRMPHQLRDEKFVRGFPWLEGADAQAAKEGNLLADRTASLLNLCVARGLPVAEENPQASWLWQLRSRRLWGQSKQWKQVCFDQCAFGKPFRARTSLMYSAIDLTALEQKRCVGRGLCAFTGRPHLQLSGLAKGSFLTTRKAVYPSVLVKRVAMKFVNFYIAGRTSRLWNVCMAVPSAVLVSGGARREVDFLDAGLRIASQDGYSNRRAKQRGDLTSASSWTKVASMEVPHENA